MLKTEQENVPVFTAIQTIMRTSSCYCVAFPHQGFQHFIVNWGLRGVVNVFMNVWLAVYLSSIAATVEAV